ncbi:MAG: TauD/TfdA family dioxygenase [Phenylobacterium sp.]|uniref:TauD/TfdA dioxygenase family protein n=1 Tax=Phenylobacterium sp. TaxID=1871053 RepID=UPI0027349A60|nr:TauD/TfdA family dioxygenase [Phenylobacterium sp.]MDP3747670.1 TauD/TfdA family dioxygenase [Phenylobacterium sp.]
MKPTATMDGGSPASEVWIQPTGAALAADVHGVDLSLPLDPEAVDAIGQAWTEHLVLRLSAQRLSDADLVRFSQMFGELDVHPQYRPSPGELPYARWVISISNIVVEGRKLGSLGYGEAAWHADMTYNPAPPRASLLYAIECPPEGGSTWFANMYAAFEDLPTEVKAQISTLSCVHDASRDSSGRLRSGYAPVDDPRATPGARHPLVSVHPVTGRPCLFLGRRAGAYVVGLTLSDSEALLDRLWAHATQDRFVWKQHWRVGDLVMWDNRCVLHRRDAFDNRQRRLMHRTQIVGEPMLGLERPARS